MAALGMRPAIYRDELGSIVNARRGIGTASVSPLGGLGIALRSNFTPEIAIQPGQDPSSPPTSSDGSSSGTALAIAQAVQPTIDAILPDGSRIEVFAPYGTSSQDWRVYAGGVLVAVLGSGLVALYVAYRLGYRSAKRGRR